MADNELPIIPEHEHNGTDSSKVCAKNLLGFKILTTAPTHQEPEGTIILVDNKVDTRTLYVRMNNTWFSVSLT